VPGNRHPYRDPPAFKPAFFGLSQDAGQKPGGGLKARPHKHPVIE